MGIDLKNGGPEGKILPVTTKDVEQRMMVLRKQTVLLDTDVADLYGVETKNILMVIFSSWINTKRMRWSKISTTLRS